MEQVALASVAFVGTHFLLSHPLRGSLVARLGERGFMGVYSLVAVATLGWLIFAYRAAPDGRQLWAVGDGLWIVATIVMLVASILFMGSLVGNPALPNPGAETRPVSEPRGVFAITRHPMMWGFALWGVSHILIYPHPSNLILCLAIIVLALVGAHLQDRKKERLQPNFWREWESRTSFVPFAAVLRGKRRIGSLGGHALGGGIVVWLVATWAHIPLAGWAAGVWKWVL